MLAELPLAQLPTYALKNKQNKKTRNKTKHSIQTVTLCTVVTKGFENDTNINVHKVCCFSVFRYFCQVLLWKTEVYYNNLISVKGFYWQFHEEDAKSQYLQCWPFFFKTFAIRPGMLSINFWATSWLIAIHSCIINAWSLSEFVGFCLSTRLLRIDHKFSMGLRSGEFPGHGPKILMFCSPSHLVITFALWQVAPSCWKRHCSSPNCSWMVGRSCMWILVRIASVTGYTTVPNWLVTAATSFACCTRDRVLHRKGPSLYNMCCL